MRLKNIDDEDKVVVKKNKNNTKRNRNSKILKFLFESKFNLIIFSIFSILVLSFVTITFNYFLFSSIKSEHIEKMQSKNSDIVNNINKIKSPLFEELSFSTDAGPYINELIPWIGTLVSDKEKLKVKIHIPQSIQEKLKLYNANWVENADKFTELKHTLHWMDKLNDFDYWNFETNSIIDEESNYLENSKFVNLHSIPDYSILIDMAKLRLIHGLNTNKQKDSFDKVYVLAQMIYSNETRLSLSAAITVLKYLNEFILKTNFDHNKKLLTNQELDLIGQIERDIESTLSPLTTLEDLNLIFSLKPKGLCEAIREYYKKYTEIKFTLNAHFIFEENFNEEFQNIDGLIRSQTQCRIFLFRKIWNDQTFYKNSFLDYVPYFRKTHGLFILRTLL